MAGRILIVQEQAIRDGNFSGRRIDGESPSSRVGQLIGKGVAAVRIRRSDRTNRRPIRRVFSHNAGGNPQVGRCIIDRRDGDRHTIGIRSPRAIDRGDGQSIGAGIVGLSLIDQRRQGGIQLGLGATHGDAA